MRTLPLLAMVEAVWRTRWNRGWRFSPWGPGLLSLLAHVGLAGLLAWQMSQGAAPGAGATETALALAAQAGLWSLLTTVLTGRTRLYAQAEPLLLFVSPAPPWVGAAAIALADLPRRALTGLIWSAALSGLITPPAPLWAPPAFWLALTIGSGFGQLAGLFLLITLIRASPRAAGALWWAAVLLQLTLFYTLIALLAAGVGVAEMGAFLARLRWWIGVALALLVLLPGLSMALVLARRPDRLSEAYREGWVALAESAARSMATRSRWPALVGSGTGAVQAREWLYALRNPFTALRIGIVALALGLLAPAAPLLERLAEPGMGLVVLGGGLTLTYFAFGEMAAALFSAEGGRLSLHTVAGVRPGQLLLGKLLSAAPLALIAAVSSGAIALAAGASGPEALRWALQAGAIGLGMTAILVGLSALDARLEEPEAPGAGSGLQAALDQVPRGPFSVAALLAAVGVAAGAVWFPWLVRLPAFWLTPLVAVGAGYLRLHLLLQKAR